jgi:hypothetical protein
VVLPILSLSRSPLIAPGSSLLVKLTNALALHALRIAGGGNKAFAESCLVLPLATGMAVSLALLTLKQVLAPLGAPRV